MDENGNLDQAKNILPRLAPGRTSTAVGREALDHEHRSSSTDSSIATLDWLCAKQERPQGTGDGHPGH